MKNLAIITVLLLMCTCVDNPIPEQGSMQCYDVYFSAKCGNEVSDTIFYQEVTGRTGWDIDRQLASVREQILGLFSDTCIVNIINKKII